MDFGTKAVERIFIVWFGQPMNSIRARSLEQIEQNSLLPVVLVEEKNIGDWEVKDSPIHRAFYDLSAIQKSDYLRSYLLHHHGGGYCDVKPVLHSWRASIQKLNSINNIFGIGYPEVGRHGVSQLGLSLTKKRQVQPFNPTWWKYRWLQINYRSLLGNGAFIFKPGSTFTFEWFSNLSKRMDFYEEMLRKHPAQHPKERPGFAYEFGTSNYPIPWGDLMANIFHPLCLKYKRNLLNELPMPIFQDYE